MQKFLSPIQSQELLKVASKNQKHKTQILLMLQAGLRVSEVLNVKVEDINFKTRILSVKSLKSKKDKKRFIPLSDDLYEALVKYISKSDYAPTDLLFTGKNGNQMSRVSINRGPASKRVK